MIYYNSFAALETLAYTRLHNGYFYSVLVKGGTCRYISPKPTRAEAQSALWRLLALRHKSPLLMIGEI